MQSPCAMLSSVSYPALQYFPLYPIKGKILYIILRRIQRETSTNVHRLICKLPVILSDYAEPFIFFDRLSKNTEIINFIKIRPGVAEMFRADKRADILAQRI